MAVKILSRSGITLASIYDVKGSRAAVEVLESREVTLVHEMGHNLLSERFSGAIRRATTGDLLQSTAWDIVLNDLPAGVSRILGITVIADVPSRSNIAGVAVRDPGSDRELPVWTWDNTNDLFRDLRIADQAASANLQQLVPTNSIPGLPSILVGGGQPQRVAQVAFRGQTSAFGAGTVEHVMLLYLALSHVGGLSSLGLPIPSW